MILATSHTDSIDPFPTLQALMNVLAEYRDIEASERDKKINTFIRDLSGLQTQTYRFKGARLEADVNDGSPAWMTTGLRVSFLLTNEAYDICVYNVTADFGAKLQGSFNI